jgi:hypothetical protein
MFLVNRSQLLTRQLARPAEQSADYIRESARETRDRPTRCLRHRNESAETKGGQFMAVKKTAKKFKGVRRRK